MIKKVIGFIILFFNFVFLPFILPALRDRHRSKKRNTYYKQNNHLESYDSFVKCTQAFLSDAQRKRDYFSRCRSCHGDINGNRDIKCPSCGWYVCSHCGSCAPHCQTGINVIKFKFFNDEMMQELYADYKEMPHLEAFNARNFFAYIPDFITRRNERLKNTFDEEGYNCFGYGRDGFDKFGFDEDHFDREGYNQYGYDRDGYDRDGYNKSGYARDGYNRDGYNCLGYDKYGFDRAGYNPLGFTKSGVRVWQQICQNYDKYVKIDDTVYNDLGYDKYGYDKDGYNAYGFDKDGFFRDGYNVDGYDRDWFDRRGINPRGFKKDGKHINGTLYDSEGFDINHRNRFGRTRNEEAEYLAEQERQRKIKESRTPDKYGMITCIKCRSRVTTYWGKCPKCGVQFTFLNEEAEKE